MLCYLYRPMHRPYPCSVFDNSTTILCTVHFVLRSCDTHISAIPAFQIKGIGNKTPLFISIPVSIKILVRQTCNCISG